MAWRGKKESPLGGRNVFYKKEKPSSARGKEKASFIQQARKTDHKPQRTSFPDLKGNSCEGRKSSQAEKTTIKYYPSQGVLKKVSA